MLCELVKHTLLYASTCSHQNTIKLCHAPHQVRHQKHLAMVFQCFNKTERLCNQALVVVCCSGVCIYVHTHVWVWMCILLCACVYVCDNYIRCFQARGSDLARSGSNKPAGPFTRVLPPSQDGHHPHQ